MMTDGIYYERRGTGPLLLLIPGGNGDAGPYAPVATALADRFTTLTYDRRGFSRSTLAGPLDEHFDRDIEDAAYLIDEFGGGQADVFGSSSGAILAMELATRHPDRVRTVVAHEPPAVRLLPDGDRWLSFFDDVHATAQSDGVPQAMAKFAAEVGLAQGSPPPGAQLPPPVLRMLERMQANLPFFVANELRQYTRWLPDFEAVAALGDRLVLAGGRDSREHLPYRPNTVLADRLGLTIHDLPGDHIGYANRGAEFAPELAGLLAR